MDELIIEMPKGAYIPVFRSSACDDGRKNTTNDRPRRIAVLPFDALPGTMEALSYGRALCMSMTAGLCGLDGVEAVAHGYLAGLSIREAAAEMGLSHAIHGCVLHSADCRRVTVHLIQTIDGTQLWAREYEFRDEESIARQTEIVRDVRREVAALLAVSFPQPRRLAMAA
jgi:TolB-like protein